MLFAAREIASCAFAALFEDREEFVNLFDLLIEIAALRMTTNAEVLFDGELVEDATPFENLAETRLDDSGCLPVLDRRVFEEYLTFSYFPVVDVEEARECAQ